MKKIIKKWIIEYWVHIVAWIAFIFYETVMVGLIFGVFGGVAAYFLHYSIHISFFYLNALVLLPWALYKKNLAFCRLPLILTLDIGGHILVNYILDYLLINWNIISHVGTLLLDKEYALRTLYRCIYFLGFSTGYYFLRNYLNEKRKTTRLESQRLQNIIRSERMVMELAKAENSFLKAQINPHFLFNTLDYIYHNIDSNAQNAADAIIILSDIMRYSINATEEDGLVFIGDEIEQVQNLLSLYQLRQKTELNFELFFDNQVKAYRIIPLVLLTLVENVFKHGKLSNVPKKAFMSIYIEDEALEIKTGNFYHKAKNITGTGNGIKNTKSRLKHTFGSSISFEVEISNEEYYEVNIKIPLCKICTQQEVIKI